MLDANHEQIFCSVKALQHTRSAEVDSAARAKKIHRSIRHSITITCDVLPVSGNPRARIISIPPYIAVLMHHTYPMSTGRKVFLALSAPTGWSPRNESWSDSCSRNGPVRPTQWIVKQLLQKGGPQCRAGAQKPANQRILQKQWLCILTHIHI